MIIYGKNVIKEVILNKRLIYKFYLDEKFSDSKFIIFLENNKIGYEFINKGYLNNLIDNVVYNGVVVDVKDY